MDINAYYGLPQNILVTDDSLWKKKGGAGKNNIFDEDSELSAPDLSFIKIPPDWNRIPSKAEAMTEEEFEEAIAALAKEDAKRCAEMKDAAKGMKEGEEIRIRMLTEYISVVSPDRKAAYEKQGGIGYTIYGTGAQELMQRGQDGKWQTAGFTEEELARASKFQEIYRAAYAEYEAEYGSIPKSADSYKTLSGYGAYNSYSAYSAYSAYSFLA
jgi:hypothetical protein